MPASEAYLRDLWIYWHQGWDRAPLIVEKCLESWRHWNPSWNIHRLAAGDLDGIVDLPGFYKNLIECPLPAFSDIVRAHLLARRGGVWVDATTWCAVPLDEWLDRARAQTGFFAFSKPASGRALSSWFLAASPRHPILQRLRSAVDEFWQQVANGSRTPKLSDDPHSPDYFWFHEIFEDILRKDAVAAQLWRDTPEISAQPPHYLQQAGLLNPITADVENHIRNKLASIYKLTRRVDLPPNLDNTILGTLFRTLNSGESPSRSKRP